MMDPELRGHILAITNRNLCSRPFEEQVRRVCCFHPAALILREKDLPDAEYGELAKEVMKICREYQVPFIPHSFMETARQLGADKIHLPLWRLREALPGISMPRTAKKGCLRAGPASCARSVKRRTSLSMESEASIWMRHR